MLMNEVRRRMHYTRPYIYLSTTPLPFLMLYPVLMTLYVDKLHRENRKDRRRRKEALLSLLPPFPSLYPPFLSSALQCRPLFVAIVTVGLCTFFLLRSGSLLDLSLTPSSPYVWAVPLPEQSRATFKEPPSCSLSEPPRPSTCLYCLYEQHMVAVFMVSDLVC